VVLARIERHLPMKRAPEQVKPFERKFAKRNLDLKQINEQMFRVGLKSLRHADEGAPVPHRPFVAVAD
jgi:hypothetical protein